MKTIIAILIFISCGFAVEAQQQRLPNGITLSPAIAEAKIKPNQKARGSFTVTNGTLAPVNVIVDPKLAVGKNGNIEMVPLPFNMDVELDSTSARIPPQQTYTFDFTVSGVSQPSALVFNVKAAGAHANYGASVAISIPSYFYLCDGKDCRNKILQSFGVRLSKGN